MRVGDAARAARSASAGRRRRRRATRTPRSTPCSTRCCRCVQHADHPRFFARIGSPSNYVGALADAAGAGLQRVHRLVDRRRRARRRSSSSVLDWLRELVRDARRAPRACSPPAARSRSLDRARRRARGARRRAGGVVYVSDQTHASVPRALRVLGLRATGARAAPPTRASGSPPAALRAAIEADRAAGPAPFCVVATAGTTSTGAVDPLDELADLCAEHGLWLHVDGAYGAPAVLTAPARAALAGLERADSLVLDPHKWLFQPYEIGCVLVREPGAARAHVRARGRLPARHRGGEVNFRDRSVQLTRGARALKLWLSVRVFGLAAFRDGGRAAGSRSPSTPRRVLRARPGWEVVTPAQLGDRLLPPRAATTTRQTRIVDGDGRATASPRPSTTVLGGRVVLRLCTINPRTTFEDIERTIERMSEVE